MMSGTSDTFSAVLSNFKTRLTKEEQETFQFVTINDVRQTALQIQREQEQFKAMMNMARLESFLEAMEQFGKTIDVFVNASAFVAFVWGPMKFILQIASTWADSFETLVDAYSKIGERMPLLEQYEFLFGSRPHMERVLALIYADILEFHRKAIRFFSGKAAVWKQIFRSTWKDFELRFRHILEGLSQHADLIKEQAALLHYQQHQEDSQTLHLHHQKYMQDRLLSLDSLRKQEDAEKDRKYREVLIWLSAAQSNQTDHDTFCAIRDENSGSGHWILKAEKVDNWMGPDIPISSILWLNGIPGAGKTILASVIIDGCCRDATSSTAYFYCKENDSQNNTCIAVFRSILSQLLTQSRDLITYFYEKFRSSGEVYLTKQGLAEQLLKLCFERIKRQQFIIIDGLDECDLAQRRLLLLFFTTMVDACDEEHPGKLRVLFVSQHYPDIENALQSASAPASIFKITEKDNKSDIAAYVQSWCTQIQKKFDLEVDKAHDIQEATCARSKGMFLFAKLVMENLNAQESQANLLEEIEIYRFPEGLQDALIMNWIVADSLFNYERIIYRLERSLERAQWITSRKLLGWMVCAKRPLYWREIQPAVSMNTNKQSFEFKELRLRDSIRIYCGSLVQVFPRDRVELVHTTAKMYITSSEHIHIWSVECRLTALCLRYLTFECFDEELDGENLRKLTLEGSLSFQDYATAKWFEHVRTIVHKAPDFISSEKESQAALEDLGYALEDFAARYEDDIQQDTVVEMAKQDCMSFENYQFHDSLLDVWNHITCYDQKSSNSRNEVSIKALSLVLSRNREFLEEISSLTPSLSFGEYKRITEFYGESIFKCPKIRCYYFHGGFKDAKARKRHINRHDRPFECDFPDCSIAEFGFATNKDLEKHKRFFHPELEDLAHTFTVTTRPTPLTPWECDLCHKRFTRRFQLRNHIRSHTGERPFACSECGKAFTRANDCKRHEKIHERRRQLG